MRDIEETPNSPPGSSSTFCCNSKWYQCWCEDGGCELLRWCFLWDTSESAWFKMSCLQLCQLKGGWNQSLQGPSRVVESSCSTIQAEITSWCTENFSAAKYTALVAGSLNCYPTSWWACRRTGERKLLLSFSVLLCGDNLCPLWCCDCMGQICKIGVPHKYPCIFEISFSHWRLKTRLCLYRQRVCCPSHCNFKW